jgi:dTDP-4-dehydrorhamnose 3,5-epimerase-like enzyme
MTIFNVLQVEDHLLRRFGQVQVIRKSPGRSETLYLREVADEVWAIIEGQVEFAWHDLRQDSPSRGHWHHLHTENPTLVLAPFGVAFGCRALEEPALLIRLSSHTEGIHSGDREMPWEFEA